MKNQMSENLAVKQKQTLEQIYQAGKVSNIEFIKNTYKFPRISQLNREEVNRHLGEIITKVSFLCGFKGHIENLYKADIADLIHKNYAFLSLQEIDKAFEIDRHNPNPVEHYQLFNSTYVSKILDNYINWRLELKKTNNIQKKQIEPLELTEEVVKKNRETLIKIVFDEINQKDFSAKAWLLYDDVSSDKKNNQQYKELLLKKVRQKHFKKEKENRTFKGTFENYIEYIQPRENSLYNECKSIIVSEYLSTWSHDYEMFKSKISDL